MTKEERAAGRRAICKDVIKQIQAKKLNVLAGVYVQEKRSEDENWWSKPPVKIKSGVITKDDCNALTKKCNVCALGSMFLSRIRLFNQVEWKSLHEDKDHQKEIMKSLKGYFTDLEMNEIECAFERDEYMHGLGTVKMGPFAKFGLEFDEPADRLLAIMQNILDNGKFDPTIEYEVVKV
jgi:hypothetical protein